jgi:L-ascorbate metabolism protein UlaG (beta-lactamase superfamily)
MSDDSGRAKMTTEKVYLKPTVVAEPLFNQWYAWSYLIAPATAAMYIANSHVKIMRSFVSAPHVHVAALKNPAMLGGPFLNYAAGRAIEIKALLAKTEKEHGHMIEFASAVKALDETLQNEAQGHSLEPLYQKVPEILKGFVELVYDLNNHPSIRFIEGLLYRSKYYDQSSQSLALYDDEKENRPFILSSPKLRADDHIHLQIPFREERLDELFKMKYVAQPFDYIKSLLNIEAQDEALFSSYFTNEPLAIGSRYMGEGVRVRYYGHACLLIETKEVNILCDPVISYKSDSDFSRYTYADLPEQIDYVLITHNHQDHCIFETLLQLRHRIKQIIVPRSNRGSLADPSLKLILNHIGFVNVQEIDEMDPIAVDGGSITGLPFLGEHGDVDIKSKVAYLLELKGKSILCAADSNNVEPKLYDRIHESTGDVDVVFLGMECDGAPLTWLYGPLLTKPLARSMDQSRRFDGSNYDKAISVVKCLNPKQVYVYAMGQEPWLTYLTSIQYTDQSRPIVESNNLVEYCRGLGMESERLFVQKEIHLS